MASPQPATGNLSTSRHRTRPRRAAPPSHVATRLCRCGAQTADYLCRDCATTLEWLVARLPGKLRDLANTVARRDRLDGLGAPLLLGKLIDPEPVASTLPAALRSSATVVALVATPWPYAPDAAKLFADSRRGLTEWASHVQGLKGAQRSLQAVSGHIPDRFAARAEGPLCADRYCAHRTCQHMRRQPPFDPDIEAALTIVRNINLVRLDPAAQAMARAFEAMDWHIDDARDRREPDIFAGLCEATNVTTQLIAGHVVTETGECGAELYARLEDPKVKCRRCGTEHDVKDIRAKLLEAVDDQWARPAIIANALTNLGAPVLVDTIYKWIQRSKERRDGDPWPDDGQQRASKWRTPPRPPRPGLDFFQVGIDDDGRALYRVGDVRGRLELNRPAPTSTESVPT